MKNIVAKTLVANSVAARAAKVTAKTEKKSTAATAAEPYRDIDFSTAKRGAVIPVEVGKTKISIRLDNAVLEHFKMQVEKVGAGNYQTLINDALVATIVQRSVLDAVRQVMREEITLPRTPAKRPQSFSANA